MEKEGSKDVLPKAPALCSQRWNLAVICAFGYLIVYVTRVNLSVAIICMVRAPRVNVTSVNQRILGKHGPSLDNSTTFANVTADNMVVEEEDVSESDCSLEMLKSGFSSNNGEFDWDKGTQSRLLALYFYGYIFTQIVGGWLAGRYGGRRVWGVSQSICALSTLATPLAARAHVYLVYALRFLLGLAAGVTFPTSYAMIGRWAPKLERSKITTFTFTGLSLGNVLTFTLSALLCVYGFDNGWGSIFYLSGLGNLLWVVVWFVVTADTPTKHKWISEAEKNYILRSIGETPEDKEILPTPWRAILTSAPVWACIIGQMCGAYTAYTLLTSLPAFMKEVLKFDIKQARSVVERTNSGGQLNGQTTYRGGSHICELQFLVLQNGGLSALPYLCETVVVLVTGQVADRLRERGILSTKNTRKLFQITANVGSSICLISAGYMNCTQRPLAVLLLCLCLSFMGLRRAGYSSNHIDLAPRHAGVVFGIANTASTVPGMIAPLVVGALTPNRTAEEWRRVFFVCAALSLLGTIVYGIFADGELQSWAAPPVELVIKECQEVKGGDKNHNDETLENHKNPAFEPSDYDCKDISPEEATSNTAEGLHSPQKVEAQN